MRAQLPHCPVAARAGRSAMNWSTPARSNAGWRSLEQPPRARDAAGRRSLLSWPAQRAARRVVLEWLSATDGADEPRRTNARAIEDECSASEPAAQRRAGGARAARARDGGAADRAGALGFFRVRRRSSTRSVTCCRSASALSDAAVDTLMADAGRRADSAVSLHEFTHRLNRELPESGQARDRRDAVARQSCRRAHRQARGAADPARSPGCCTSRIAIGSG